MIGFLFFRIPSINEEIALRIKLYPGQKLCRTCQKKSETIENYYTNDETRTAYTPTGSEFTNKAFRMLGCSTLKSVSFQGKPSYGKHMLKSSNRLSVAGILFIIELTYMLRSFSASVIELPGTCSAVN